MKSSKFWIAVVAAGIAMNVVDFVVQGQVLNGMYYSKMPDVFNMSANPLFYVLGDLVAVFIFCWFYDRVYGSFSGGAGGGALFGSFAGVFANFPAWIFLHLMIKGLPYGFSWVATIYGVVWYVIAGAIVGSLYKKSAA
jgi:hypothetical protein